VASRAGDIISDVIRHDAVARALTGPQERSIGEDARHSTETDIGGLAGPCVTPSVRLGVARHAAA